MASSRKTTSNRKATVAKGKAKEIVGSRIRTQRPYPAWTFEASLGLAKAIQEHASGEKVARLTLLGKLDKSPNSSQTHSMITNSAKYGLTKGSYVAEYLELTPTGALISSSTTTEADRIKHSFGAAVSAIKPFNTLYERYKNKRLPAHEILRDSLNEAKIEVEDVKECIDLFVVNLRFLGLLKTIAGAETLIGIETRLEEIGGAGHANGEASAKTYQLSKAQPKALNGEVVATQRD